MNSHIPLDGIVVCETNTIAEAWQAIGRGKFGIAVVNDQNGRVIGVITDGDIRRALLSGKGLESKIASHYSQKFTSVSPETHRDQALDIMQAKFIRQLPVIDKDGVLVGIHTLRDILGGTPKDNWAVIMAGGKGTRLRPMTENLPKPMINVAGRPILERLILHLVGQGIRRVFISVKYLSEIIMGHFCDGKGYGCRIEYLVEDEPLGTGGALSLLPEKPTQPILVMNGDLIMQASIHNMLEHHVQEEHYATMGLRPYFHRVPFGCVELGEKGRIVELEEKPLLEKMVNAGVYVLSPDAVATIPKSYYPITEVFTEGIKQNKTCGTYMIESDWLDVGQPHQLAIARGEY